MQINENCLRRNQENRTSTTSIILSWIGNILCLIYFATPFIQIIKAYKNTLDIKVIPLPLIIFIILNCLLWLLNAFASDDLSEWIPLLISNGLGIILNLAIFFLYLNLFLNKNVKKFFFYGFFLINVIAQITYAMFRYIILKDKEKEEDKQKEVEFHYIGFTATIINVLMYSSPIFNIIRLIKTKSSDLLPIFTLGVGFLCTMIFLIQGVVSYNFYDYEDEIDQRVYAKETIISNGISFFLIACQIGFWAYYHLTQKKQEEDFKISNNNMNERLNQSKLDESLEN